MADNEYDLEEIRRKIEKDDIVGLQEMNVPDDQPVAPDGRWLVHLAWQIGKCPRILKWLKNRSGQRTPDGRTPIDCIEDEWTKKCMAEIAETNNPNVYGALFAFINTPNSSTEELDAFARKVPKVFDSNARIFYACMHAAVYRNKPNKIADWSIKQQFPIELTQNILTKNGSSTNDKSPEKDWPLNLAVILNWQSALEGFLKAGMDPNETIGDSGHFPFLTATLEDHISCVELLLKNRANPNQIINNGKVFPLLMAAQLGHPCCVLKLLEADALRTQRFNTPHTSKNNTTTILEESRSPLESAFLNFLRFPYLFESRVLEPASDESTSINQLRFRLTTHIIKMKPEEFEWAFFTVWLNLDIKDKAEFDYSFSDSLPLNVEYSPAPHILRALWASLRPEIRDQIKYSVLGQVGDLGLSGKIKSQQVVTELDKIAFQKRLTLSRTFRQNRMECIALLAGHGKNAPGRTFRSGSASLCLFPDWCCLLDHEEGFVELILEYLPAAGQKGAFSEMVDISEMLGFPYHSNEFTVKIDSENQRSAMAYILPYSEQGRAQRAITEHLTAIAREHSRKLAGRDDMLLCNAFVIACLSEDASITPAGRLRLIHALKCFLYPTLRIDTFRLDCVLKEDGIENNKDSLEDITHTSAQMTAFYHPDHDDSRWIKKNLDFFGQLEMTEDFKKACFEEGLILPPMYCNVPEESAMGGYPVALNPEMTLAYY